MTLLSEEKLSLSKLAHREDVHVSTVWRWVQRGVRGVRLESYTVGGRRYTTCEAFERFCLTGTSRTQGVEADLAPRSTNRRRKSEIIAAEAKLAKAGA